MTQYPPKSASAPALLALLVSAVALLGLGTGYVLAHDVPFALQAGWAVVLGFAGPLVGSTLVRETRGIVERGVSRAALVALRCLGPAAFVVGLIAPLLVR